MLNYIRNDNELVSLQAKTIKEGFQGGDKEGERCGEAGRQSQIRPHCLCREQRNGLLHSA